MQRLKAGGRLVAAGVFGAVALAALAPTPTLSARLDVSPISLVEASQRLDRATVEILALGCDLALRQGSAVAVSSGELLTNAHVVGAFRSVDIAADARPVTAAGTVTVNPSLDVAVIRSAAMPVAPLTLAPKDPRPGEPVHLAGYPHDSRASGTADPKALPDGLLVVRADVVDYVDGLPLGQTGKVMRVSAAARPGMSGGPVLDQAGRLAALVFAVQSPSAYTLAIPASALRGILAIRDSMPTGRCQSQ